MLVTGSCLSCDKETWVDSMAGICRECEIDRGERWGHHGAKAKEGTQVQKDTGESLQSD